MSCNCCGEDNKLLYCNGGDCYVCVKCIKSGNLENYGCDECEEKEDCEALEYEKQITANKSNDKALEQMCKQISDFIFKNYNPHTSVIITEDSIQVVEDKFGSHLKRY